MTSPSDDQDDQQLHVVDSEWQAKERLGKTVVLGGWPYRVTGCGPGAEVRWEVRGVGLPVHPGVDDGGAGAP